MFHLYGHLDTAQSLVLTEDDYFDFLIAVSADMKRIPPGITCPSAKTNLLFLGYRVISIGIPAFCSGS